MNVLDQLDILDVTITPSPANRNSRLVSIKAEPKRTVNREALEALVAFGKAMLGAVDYDGKFRGLVTDPMTTGRVTEIDRLNAQLNDLENTKAGPTPGPDAVDRFVTETRQMMVEEALARAEQAEWERRMDINLVLHPVPL